MQPAFVRTASRGSAVAWIALAALILSCDAAPNVPPDVLPNVPPNIVLVISDDHGWRDYGFMGSEMARTPNLDALAASGTVFTHGFTTASACRPSLRSLLTGLEPQRIRALEQVLAAQQVPFPEIAAVARVDTLPRELARAGYVSFQGGKHWEGRYELTGFDAGTATGFDAERANKRGLIHELAGGDGLDLGRTTMAPLFDFIRAHARERFFVWFAPMLPHVPHDPPPAMRKLYATSDLGTAAKRYFGSVSWLDARIGELIAELEALGLRDRTLIVFVADNGWQQDLTIEVDLSSLGDPQGKFSIGEIGFRTPMIFSWPGSLPAGRRDDTLVSTLDLFPTLLDFAGVREGGSLVPPSGRTGVNLRDLLEGGAAPDREHLIAGMEQLRSDQGARPPDEQPSADSAPTVRDEEGFFLRAPGWRYVWLPERGLEQLFAIDDDPDERVDVSAHQPDLVARSRAAVEGWRLQMRVPAPIRPEPDERAAARPGSP